MAAVPSYKGTISEACSLQSQAVPWALGSVPGLSLFSYVVFMSHIP